MPNNNFDILIVGCGPAGLSAAIYGSRAQLKTVVFGDPTKGNLYKSHIIANYFGFPKPLTGPELTQLGLDHAKDLGTEIIENDIVDIKINDDETFTLKDDKQNLYTSKTVIITTGQSYALSGIKNEQALTGKGVSYCVICDGAFFKDKNVVVVGNGNYAAEEAIQLLNYTKKITIFSHGKDFKFSDEMKNELDKTDIKLERTDRIKEIGGAENAQRAEKLIMMDNSEKEVDGVFMAVGVAGATAFSKKLGLEMEGNYIKVDMGGNSNIKGLFAAGDCTGSPPQVASSVGNGCNAALSAIKLIRGLKIYIDYD